MSLRFGFTGFVDEVFKNIDKQIEFAKKLGLKYICLRFLELGDGKVINVYDLTTSQARLVRKKLDDAGLIADVAGTPFGKKHTSINDGVCPNVVSFSEVLSEAKRVADILKILGVHHARVFGGNLDPSVPFNDVKSQVIDQIAQFTEVFSEASIFTHLENEGFTACPSAENIAEVCNSIDSDWLIAVFDEGNQIAFGHTNHDQVIAAYKTAIAHLGGVHIKCLSLDDPNLCEGKQVKENTLTLFTRPQGKVFETIFADMAATAITTFGEICKRVRHDSAQYTCALEPHRARSERDFGESDPEEFLDSAIATAELAENAGLVSEPTSHFLRSVTL